MFFLVPLLFTACEKPVGKNYLRIYDQITDSVTNLSVQDEFQAVPVDGQYHEVSKQLEIGYLIPDKIFDSVVNYTTDLFPWPAVSYTDVYVSRYFGEFEVDEADRYYTLKINYNKFLNEPKKSYFSINGKYWYSIYIQYYDSSQLTFKYEP